MLHCGNKDSAVYIQYQTTKTREESVFLRELKTIDSQEMTASSNEKMAIKLHSG